MDHPLRTHPLFSVEIKTALNNFFEIGSPSRQNYMQSISSMVCASVYKVKRQTIRKHIHFLVGKLMLKGLRSSEISMAKPANS
jgi:hypothetical protein